MPTIVGAISAGLAAFSAGAAGALTAIGVSAAAAGSIATSLTTGLLLTGAQIGLNSVIGGGGTPSVNLSQKLQSQITQGQPQYVAVGQTALGGHRAFDGSHGGDNETEFYTQVVILSYKPINSLVNMRVNGQIVNFSGDVETGERTATNPELQGVDAPRMRARVFLGNDNVGEGLGLYLAGLFPNEFNIVTNFGDYAVAVLQFQKTDDDFVEEGDDFVNRSPFQSLPRYRFEVEGATVFDPRDPTQSHDDPQTWVYSSNSALIESTHDIGWRSGSRTDRLLVGSGYPYALLDEGQVIDNADYCDAAGFTCNGILVSGSQSDASHIRATFGGIRYEDPALIYTVPRANRPYAGQIDLTDSRVENIQSFDPWGRASRVPNSVRTRYSNPATFYEEEVLEYISSQAQIDADGGLSNTLDQDLRMVTDADIATDLRTIELAFQRRPRTLTIGDLPPYRSSLRGGQLIDVFGSENPLIEGAQWAVSGIGQDDQFRVSLNLTEMPPPSELETDPADYPTITSSVAVQVQPTSFVVPGFLIGGEIPIFIILNVSETVIEGASPALTSVSVSGTTIAPISYQWTFINGDAGITPNAATDPLTQFTGTAGEVANYRLTATDSTTPAALSQNETIQVRII